MTLPAGSALFDDELLDHPDADPAAVAVSLHNISVANRWFGGWWAVRRGLLRVTRRLDGSNGSAVGDARCRVRQG